MLYPPNRQPANSDFTYDPALRAIINGDMLHSGLLPLSALTNGTAAAAALDGNQFEANNPGVARLQTGTDTAGRAGLTTIIHDVAGGSIFEAVIKIEDLATAGEDFDIFVGWGNDQAGSEHTDGYYFKYDRGTSPNWIICTNDDDTATRTTTSTAVVADAYINLKIVVNAARTSAEYFVNGVSVGTVSTSLPDAGEFLYGMAKIIKSAGTTSRDLYVDLISCNLKVSRGI